MKIGKSLFRTAAAGTLFALALTPAFAVTIKKPSERKTAPAFELKNAAGEPVKLADYKGKVVLIDFWATWCLPCKAAMPWMNELAAKYKADGVEVLGISMDDDGWEVVKPFIAEMGVKYPIVLGNKRVGYLYGEIDNLPVAFFVDRDQKVAGIHLGAASRKQFESAIQALLKTK
jgi:thiol-disulfide isomerase/thioredoxin